MSGLLKKKKIQVEGEGISPGEGMELTKPKKQHMQVVFTEK